MLSSQLVLTLSIFTVGGFAALGVRYAWGRIQTMDDYITARGTTESITLSATLLASFLGVFILFTPAEAAIFGGIPAIIGYALGPVALYWVLMELAPRMKQYLPGGSSLTDFAWVRYGKSMYLFTVLLSLFYMFVHLVAELTAIALVAQQLSGIPLWQTALLVGVGTVLYTAYGGLKASMFTDSVQMKMTVFLLFLISLSAISLLGGWLQVSMTVRETVPQLLTLNNPGGIQYGFTLLLAVLVSNVFHQGYWQRVYAGRDNETVKKAFRIAIPLVILIMLVAGLFGILAASFGAGETPSTAVFSLAGMLFPSWLLIAIYILALLLVMSTVDTLLNAIASLATVDRSKMTGIAPERLLYRSRIFTVLLVLPAIAVAAQGYSVLQLFLAADLICAGAIFPLFYGLYNPSHNEKTALWAAMAGIATGIPLFRSGQLLLSFLLALMVSIIVTQVGGYWSNRHQPAGK